MEFDGFLDYYSSEYYLTYTNTISREGWGNRNIAVAYLEKYYLPEDEYLRVWKPIQDVIFKNGSISLPEIVFEDTYSLLALRGGVMFAKEDFQQLQTCAKIVGDQNIVIIRNTFGEVINEPIFKMKYPVDTPWDELMSGNFISTVLFEMFHDEYFVFSESGMWGMYCANDYESPLNIMGFKPDYADIFRTQFKQSNEEESEIMQWLPKQYIDLIKFQIGLLQ